MKKTVLRSTQSTAIILTLLCSTFLFAGCGGGGGGSSSGGGGNASAYDNGYDNGFLDDTEYFFGYDDSFDNDSDGPSLYEGDLLPFSPDNTYQAGFWDGQFDAYNDGYFVAYRFAFIIGFSEGYDNAYWDDYLDFLANDWHVELLHAGFRDGYYDGFSEGRIFGANDYEAFLAFDWLDAFLDWESGTDLYFEEVDKGTGDFGPVILYEWAQNPHDLFSPISRSTSTSSSSMTMRSPRDLFAASSTTSRSIDAARVLTVEQEAELNVTPGTTARTDRPLSLSTTWGQRIDSYQQQVLFGSARSVSSNRAEGKRGKVSEEE